MIGHPAVVAALTLAGVVVLKLLYLFVVGKGSLSRVGTAWSIFNKVMGDQAAADKVKPILTPPPREPPKLLVLLQRDGRLFDFLLEDVSGATDDQLGAGVREVHKKSQAVLKEH